MRPQLLVLIERTPDALARLEQAGFDLHVATTPEHQAAVIAAIGPEVRAVLTNGTTGLSADEMARLPRLEIVCCVGAGYEKVDVVAARSRGIVVTHGPATNDASVADHAMALLMAVARAIPQADAAVRRGEWARSRQLRPMISGKRLGILGLGNIGRQIARRGAGGFDMPVAYHNRRVLEGCPYTYCPSPAALAEWADFMVIATPGGSATAHLVDAAVLEALGPHGYLVNIGRGSVVDTGALIDALKHGRVAGAALDVIDGEPEVPAELTQLANVVLTPHIAGRSPEAVAATAQLVLDNLAAHFAGHPVLTPAPQPT